MSLGKLVHYPWLGDQARERFAFGAPWCDPDGLLLLNGEQRAHFGRWARPSEFMRGEPRMIYLVSPLTITQTIITDCSFVSSLVIAASFERRFRTQLVTAILYPQDRAGVPIYNPAGKYMVRLKFNGVSRRILVDDRLPLHTPSSHLLFTPPRRRQAAARPARAADVTSVACRGVREGRLVTRRAVSRCSHSSHRDRGR